MKKFNKEIAENVTKSLISIGFKIDSVWYDKERFGNFGVSLILQDDKLIIISMMRDRIYLEFTITKEQFLVMPDGSIDYYHFFPENTYIEDLLNAVGIDMPEINRIQKNDVNVLEAMQVYSKLISKNIELIKNSLKYYNIIETKKLVDLASIKREVKWSKE